MTPSADFVFVLLFSLDLLMCWAEAVQVVVTRADHTADDRRLQRPYSLLEHSGDWRKPENPSPEGGAQLLLEHFTFHSLLILASYSSCSCTLHSHCGVLLVSSMDLLVHFARASQSSDLLARLTWAWQSLFHGLRPKGQLPCSTANTRLSSSSCFPQSLLSLLFSVPS